jgi:hypothetical protein
MERTAGQLREEGEVGAVVSFFKLAAYNCLQSYDPTRAAGHL